MMQRMKITFLLLVLTAPSAFSQKLKKADKLTLENLETHIRYLADDQLEGRRTGSPGEKMAGEYISAELRKAGLQPRGENGGWLQSFEVNDGKKISDDTHFFINNQELLPGRDYFPFPFSAIGTVTGSPAIALHEKDTPWFVDLKDLLEAGQGNPHFDLEGAVQGRVKDCVKKGATAIIFYNSSKTPDNLGFDPKDPAAALEVPVLYVTKEAKRKYLKDESASQDIKIRVGISEMKRTGHNVLGYLDNGASTTVVIGAHYDHLGHGEDSNSLYRGTDRPVFNGADDNASGTAGMIELARLLKQSKLKGNNYLFIAFSGEELGLFGSHYFVEHPTVPLASVNYMINLDMIGRLNDTSHALTLGGYGTSPAWGEVSGKINGKKYFAFRYDSSGMGPSDHTSFYSKDIPVLFFFTGIHADYHKPTDDYDKINYSGELQVVKYIYALVESLNNRGRIAFTKTRDTQFSQARFSVTLGILPDYSFSGGGVRIDAISEGRPAQKAGLQAGDIIIGLGDFTVSSLDNYMDALSAFKKGDTAKLKYIRASKTAETAVQF
ncbi:MAG: M28 family peptidase [Puia sp.]|nr:M28 family peptidase [Puia sp.]